MILVNTKKYLMIFTCTEFNIIIIIIIRALMLRAREFGAQGASLPQQSRVQLSKYLDSY